MTDTFRALRRTCSSTIHLVAVPTIVFPLFTPQGERAWVPGWEPHSIYPHTGEAELDGVFATVHGEDDPTIWTIVDYAPDQGRIAYVRVAPASHVAHIIVHCREAPPDASEATISYVFTGLSEAGNAYVARHSEAHYQHWLFEWQAAINAYLARASSTR